MFKYSTTYLLFLLSGLSALIYQVLWVRSFSLIFGGSHMAVTTVLSVFMGGLALGGYLGKRIDRHSRPLKVYGLLEIGIGLAAILLLGLLQWYPQIYVAFARLVDNDATMLTLGRLLFAVLAMLLPTTLMGLTLPTLAGFVERQRGDFGRHVSLLYGLNTLGAVAGAVAAGFILLRYFTVSSTYLLAIGISLLVGLLALRLDSQYRPESEEAETLSDTGIEPLAAAEQMDREPLTSGRLILFGIGISGFCALGYEVLWTRVLSIVIGTTVYGYTLMLVAFLLGIAAGGASYRWLQGRIAARGVFCFGAVQVVIGISALLVSYALRDLPNFALAIEEHFQVWFSGYREVRQATNLSLALLYMLVPAFFMGLAFPLAAHIVARTKRSSGEATGITLTFNTVGAILGAAISGFLLVRMFGIERSLQLLSLLNLGLGLTVWGSLSRRSLLRFSPVLVSLLLMVYLVSAPEALRIWNMKFFAVFNHNARQHFVDEKQVEDLLSSSEVLYYAEGMTSTISVVKIKDSNQAIQVNGRTVASSGREDQQCQYTLGHLPMLLHQNPRKVWVLGMGTGMTAGATAIHPEVEEVVIVELEKHVPAAARTFAAYNHNLLDNPKVRVEFNDGRNFLLTTEERYDVITADPIHPWSQGAAYLYTDEYYRLAANRLLPGGVMCQWLPIYELSPTDLRSVVRTFANNFRYTYVWLTDYDAELVGSNEPLEIDVDQLQQRLNASPAVLADLENINMGSAAAFLSYCIMGPEGSRAYGAPAPLNTDNNLYLEFSAPDSKGISELMAVNIGDLNSNREPITGYLSGRSLPESLGTDPGTLKQAVKVYDRAHQLHHLGRDRIPAYAELMTQLKDDYPWFAPGQFLRQEYQQFLAQIPELKGETTLLFSGAENPVEITFSAVSIRLSETLAKLVVVDNRAREIYGSIYVEAQPEEMEEQIGNRSRDLLASIWDVYQQLKQGQQPPPVELALSRIETVISDFDSEQL